VCSEPGTRREAVREGQTRPGIGNPLGRAGDDEGAVQSGGKQRVAMSVRDGMASARRCTLGAGRGGGGGSEIVEVEGAEAGLAAKPLSTWLGMEVTRLDQPVQRRVNLPEGVGLMVHEVVEGSPGAKAGLERSDVLHKLDEPLLINPERLAVSVRMHKRGEEVKLAVVRKGARKIVRVQLGRRGQSVGPSGRWRPLHGW